MKETAELEKYKALISASDTGAWEYFSATDFLWCNALYFAMLGRDIRDYEGSGQSKLKAAWTNLLHPGDKENAKRRFKDFLQNPIGMYENEFRMQHKDGSWVWIWSRGRLFSMANHGAPPVIIGTHVDISKHKEAEEAIRQERILLRTLIDSLPDAIFVKDVEGRKIIASRADVAHIGLVTEAEVLGKTDLDLFNNDIGRRGYEDDMRVLQSGEPILNREEYFLDAAGAKRWLLTTKIPVRDERDRIVRLLGIAHDITARKQAEEELNNLNNDLKALNTLLKAQKEQELEKAIAQGKFEIASEVLHDIGNAMVGFGSHLNRINRAIEGDNLESMKSMCSFLKGQQAAIAGAIGATKADALVTIAAGIVKTREDKSGEIRTAVTELLNIITHIQEILNIQRQLVRGHTGVHERKPVNLVKIIDDCRAMLFASVDKKSIALKVSIKPGDYTVKGDPTKLMQVILNILKNSIEAIGMDAAEKKISLEMKNTGGLIELVVTDNGQGFSPETGNLFFVRGFTTKKNGTGLGLYNCRTVIESHGGSLEIKSHGPGLGAVTTIRIAV